MIIGEGISATDAGEIWHLLDTRFHIPLTLIPLEVFNRSSLNKYNTIILPSTSGSFQITESSKEKLKTWVLNGGVLIGFENALAWLNSAGLGKFDMKKEVEKKDEAQPQAYADIEEFNRAQETNGAIFTAIADVTHPLLFGYSSNAIPIFKSNNLFMEKSKNAYANPLVFSPDALLSGYISRENYARLKHSSVAGISAYGQGRVIGFTDNLCFRAFWFGTNKILLNAIFYGSLVDPASSR
jgi:hypothetical protein